MTLIILLSDFNHTYNTELQKALTHIYPQFIEDGLIRIIQPPRAIYPNFDKIRRTYIDSFERLKWRAKQNIDYAYLFHYSSNISDYYLQLEDDVLCASNFIQQIRNNVYKHNSITIHKWFMLEFSRLGFIGKLFRSSDLPFVSQVLLTYFDSQPGDLMLGKMLKLKNQPKPVHSKYSLFQHNGKFSSLKNKLMPVVDEYFKDADHVVLPMMQLPKGDYPDADIFTTFEEVEGFPVRAAYDQNASTFFWASKAKRHQVFQLTFRMPQNFSRIVISTGDERRKRDSLLYGVVSVATLMYTKTTPELDKCGSFKSLVDFIEGEVDTKAMGIVIPMNIVCLKIVPKLTSRTWVKIREIVLIH